jgi:hypothetical protein
MRLIATLLSTTLLFATGQSNLAKADAPNRVMNKVTRDQMAGLLRDFGYKTVPVDDRDGKYLKATVSDYDFRIYFRGCADDGCEGVQLSAGFDKSPKFNIAFANKWNNEHFYARANVDPTDGSFYFDYDFLVKGVTPQFVKSNMLLFVELLDDLESAAK